MTFMDALHYVAIGNPVCKAVIGTSSSILSGVVKSGASKSGSAPIEVLTSAMPPLWKQTGYHYNFMRLAGLSGLSAVMLGAWGNHRLGTMHDKGESKAIFETANRFHFYHTIALIAAPMSKYPLITGSLMMMGIIMFSGTLYYRAFTGNKIFAQLAPMGGTCLMAGWISLML